MKRIYWIIFFLLAVKISYSQTNTTEKEKYLEDQIYISLTYNLLLNKPVLIDQNGFSGGFSMGFIKDFPFNKNRTFGVGLGVGYSYNALIQNLRISKNQEASVFEEAVNFNSNKLTLKSIDIPIEIRWRNSTSAKFKFWRIYSGVKFSYITSGKSKYKNSLETVETKNITELNRFQTGLTLAAGYGTWNLYLYYALNPIFNKALLNNTAVNLKQFNIGVKFYIM